MDGGQDRLWAGFRAGLLQVRAYRDRKAMGAAVAADVVAAIEALQREQSDIRLVLAAAPSQAELLRGLAEAGSIRWERITVLHMDEYAGLPPGSGQSFSTFLKRHLLDRVRPKAVHYIDGTRAAEEELARYTALVQEGPLDLVCLGIGENGHLAFNDPPVADFADPQRMKRVLLDERCRQQQVNDGCFARLDEVPREALTLTIPTLLSGRRLFCTVPGRSKRQAVADTLLRPIHTDYPSTILRTHPDCRLYVDADSLDIDIAGAYETIGQP